MPRRPPVIELTDDVLAECEDVLEYEFRSSELLQQALTHASIARTRSDSNERLEFLGDAILGSVVCEELFNRYPDSPEGELTRIKSVLVSRSTCAKVTHKLALDEFLFLGKGLTNGARIPGSIAAAVLEAVIGAMYLDGGRDVARDFILRCLDDLIPRVAESTAGVNYKSLLQQLAQRSHGQTPVYQVLDEKGPDHSKCFQVSAAIGERNYAAAWGPSKKEAEQLAAKNALVQLDGLNQPIQDRETDLG
ncbi:MAG: ribonuclease III [Planctomycetaceae bacterium]|nr:ribonuclease III [Planctomycetaceae bacterium]